MFDLDGFVEDCRRLASGPHGPKKVLDLMREAMADPEAVSRAVPPLAPKAGALDAPVFRSSELTVLNVALRPGMLSIPHDHHIWQVQTELADLCDVERLHRVGLDQPRPSRKTWPSCQDVGDTLWREGWPGLLTLSGARPDHTVLCLFTTNWPPPDASPVRVTEIREMPTPPLGMTT